MKKLRIGTRKSQLALWQADYVRTELLKHHPELEVELVKMTTQGDKILDTPLAKIGGKGLFVKELEQALLEGSIDLAVHSTKDVTVDLPDGLHISTFCQREDPRDAFIANDYADLAALPEGARVGTSSLRRQCQLHAAFPHLQIITLRGNVNTRLAKLDAGEYDAIILAAAGMKRLGFHGRIRDFLPVELSLPAVGQGAVCIECRHDDPETNQYLAPLDHRETRMCVQAERALNARLEGGCQVPIGGHAVLNDDRLYLRGLVGSPDGNTIIRAEASGPIDQAIDLGRGVAEELLSKGAGDILRAVYAEG